MVPDGARVLDLGCGSGVPMTQALAYRYRVHGVDASARQVAAARRNVPGATFQQADITDLALPPASYDGVVAFYSLTHVPREHLAGLLRRAYGWLRPTGTLVASFGTTDDPGTIEGDWLGVPMFFSHFDAATNIELVELAGFQIRSAQTIVDPEEDGPAAFLWIAAVTGAAGPRPTLSECR
jgi:cyclopropane fatty-acyl-phospholipid synthase-like methyltransferase